MALLGWGKYEIFRAPMKPQKDLKKSDKELKALKEVVKHVVTSSLGHISLRCLLERILRDQSDNLGDVQDFLQEMLAMYHYEETLTFSTIQAIHTDIHQLQLQLQKVRQKGFAVHSLGCGLCSQHLAKACGKSVVFQCNHKYHTHIYCNVHKWDFHCDSCLDAASIGI